LRVRSQAFRVGGPPFRQSQPVRISDRGRACAACHTGFVTPWSGGTPEWRQAVSSRGQRTHPQGTAPSPNAGTHPPAVPEHRAGEIRSFSVLGARLTWIMFGPVAAVMLLVEIVSHGTGWFTRLDAAFGGVVGLMILGRWVEQRSGCATTSTGEPATLEQCKRYTVLVLLGGAAAWVAANVLGNYLLR
jgi:hypothetical protein